jgi:hypothetical protein
MPSGTGTENADLEVPETASSPVELSPSDQPASRWYGLLAKAARPRVRLVLLGAALLLVSPSVFSGFAADDWILLYELRRPPDAEWAGTPPLDLYRLFDAPHTKRLIDGAGLPWWTYADAQCMFLRPLSGFTHMLDHWLARDQPIWAHLHCLFWFALFLLAASELYRRTLEPPWVAGVAFAMFALDTAHGGAVGWVVNRSAVVGAAFALWSLVFHHRYRVGEGVRYGLAAWSCFGLALMSAELSLGMLGYLFAYALFMERGPLLRRALSLLPFAPLFVLWAIARKLGGYGTSGLYTYVDPAQEPLSFLSSLPARVALLIAGQGVRLVSDFYEMLPLDIQPLYVLLALGGCALMLWFASPQLRERRALRFFAAGALLSAVPMGSTQPSDRLLTLIGVGVLPVLAGAIHGGFLSVSRLRRKLAAGFCVLHLLLAPLFLPVSSLGAAAMTSVILGAESSLPDDPRLRERSVIALVVPDSTFMSYIQVIRSVKDKPRPRHLYWLASTEADVKVERRAAHVLRLSPARGFYDHRSEARSPLHPFARGDRVELSEMTIEIVELTSDGRPAVCDFVFKSPLEAARYDFRTWRDGRLQSLPLMPVGATLTLSANWRAHTD